MRTGTMTATDPAMSTPYFATLDSLLDSRVRPTCRVIIEGSETMTRGHRESFHSKTMLTSATVTMLGAEIDMTMRVSLRQCPAPSISAASRMDVGSVMKC